MSCTDLTTCECGCGQEFSRFDLRNRERRFIDKHRKKAKKETSCMICGKKFHIKPYLVKKNKNSFCSKECYRRFLIGRPTGRRKEKPECKNCGKKLTVFTGKTGLCFKCWMKTNIGENHPKWKGDKCKKKDERSDSLYQNWVKMVKRRDNCTCKINNKDCSGYCIVHHILPWRDFPELRYNINNGITLCQAHHPLKRAEEKRLIPSFQGLVPVSNALI